MGRTFLGEFEQRVLLAILRCDQNAYPIEIRKEIARASDPEGLAAGDAGIRVGTNERSEVTVAFVGFELRPS